MTGIDLAATKGRQRRMWASGDKGFIGELLRLVGRYAPPPSGLRSPVDSGSHTRMRELLWLDIRIETQERMPTFRHRSAEEFGDFFLTNTLRLRATVHDPSGHTLTVVRTVSTRLLSDSTGRTLKTARAS